MDRMEALGRRSNSVDLNARMTIIVLLRWKLEVQVL